MNGMYLWQPLPVSTSSLSPSPERASGSARPLRERIYVLNLISFDTYLSVHIEKG